MNTDITHEHEALPSPGLHAVFHIPCMDTLKWHNELSYSMIYVIMFSGTFHQ